MMNENNNSSLEDQFQLLKKIYISNSGNHFNYTKEDKEAYLLSLNWYKECNKIYARYSNQNRDKEAPLDEEINLPPIDNSDLMDDDVKFYNDDIPNYFFLNQKKKVDIDFIPLKTNDWNQLLSKFGGGPALPVPLATFNKYHTTMHPVVNFFNIFVSYKDILNQKFVTYGEINGKELENKLRSFFNVQKFEKTQLTCFNKIVDADKTLDKQLIMPRSCFKLEYLTNLVSAPTKKMDLTKTFMGYNPPSIQKFKEEEKSEPNSLIKSFTHHEKKHETEKNSITHTFTIPPPQQQLKIFRELERVNDLFTEGENNAYLISLNWFRFWKSIVDPESSTTIQISNNDHNNDDEDQSDTTIPPIDNRDLMTFDEKTQKMKLDRTKKEQLDFRILHPTVWKKLHEWFGGGPEIAVPVYFSPTQKMLAPVVEFIDIPIDYKDNKDNLFEIGKNTPLSLIHARAKVHFNVPENEETRICVLNQSSYRALPDNLNQTLDSYVLFNPTTHLVLDFKEKGRAEWNLNATSTSTCRSSSSMRPIANSRSFSDFNEENRESQNSNLNDNNDYDSLSYSQAQHSLDKILPTNDDTDSDDYYKNRYSNNRFSILRDDNDDTHYSHNYYNKDPEGPGVCGLMNLGNTCFFNSGIQCLVHTRLLVKYILRGKWQHELNRSNPIGMHGEVAEAFAGLTFKIWSGHYNTVSPNQMKDVIGRFAPQFSGYGQQDSHELITFMLDGIHEDLNRVTKKPVVDSISGDGTNDEEIADESWRRYKMRNDSIIVDLFHSQLRSRLVCPKCNKVTVVFDPYMSIQLPISKPNKQQINLVFVPSKFSKSYIDMLGENDNGLLFDVECKHIKISISKNRRLLPSEVSELVSNKIGRKVNVIICSKETVSFGPCLFKIGANPQGFQNYALEIPEQESDDENGDDRKYIICSLVNRAKKRFSFYASGPDDFVDIMPPFLLPIPSFNISPADLLKRCNDFFEGFWSGDDTPLTNEQKAFMDNLKIELLRASDDDEKAPRFLCEKSFNTLFPSRDYDSRVASTIFPVSVNQEAMGEGSNFSFSLFLKHLKDRKYRSLSMTSSDLFPDSTNNSVDLEKCFKYFSTNETLDENNKWFCPNCRDFVCADKKMDIWSAPEVLVIQLKRFIRYNECFMKKLDTTVNYPSKIDISKYLAGPQRNEKMLYRLYAVSEHSGSLNGGHYTAHAKVSKKDMSEEGGKWYSFNDSFVNSSSKKAAHNSGAYVLFYERINKESKDDSQ